MPLLAIKMIRMMMWKHKWNLLKFSSATNITFLSETVKISLHFIDNIFQLYVALNQSQFENTLSLEMHKN